MINRVTDISHAKPADKRRAVTWVHLLDIYRHAVNSNQFFLSPCHTVNISFWGSFLTNLGWPSSSSAFTLHSSLCFTCCGPKHGDSLWNKQHTDTLIMLLCRWLQCLFIKMLKGSRQSFLVKVGVNRRFTFSALSWLFLLPLFCFYSLSDCKDRRFHQLQTNRLLTNEMRVALNGD